MAHNPIDDYIPIDDDLTAGTPGPRAPHAESAPLYPGDDEHDHALRLAAGSHLTTLAAATVACGDPVIIDFMSWMARAIRDRGQVERDIRSFKAAMGMIGSNLRNLISDPWNPTDAKMMARALGATELKQALQDRKEAVVTYLTFMSLPEWACKFRGVTQVTYSTLGETGYPDFALIYQPHTNVEPITLGFRDKFPIADPLPLINALKGEDDIRWLSVSKEVDWVVASFFIRNSPTMGPNGIEFKPMPATPAGEELLYVPLKVGDWDGKMGIRGPSNYAAIRNDENAIKEALLNSGLKSLTDRPLSVILSQVKKAQLMLESYPVMIDACRAHKRLDDEARMAETACHWPTASVLTKLMMDEKNQRIGRIKVGYDVSQRAPTFVPATVAGASEYLNRSRSLLRSKTSIDKISKNGDCSVALETRPGASTTAAMLSAILPTIDLAANPPVVYGYQKSLGIFNELAAAPKRVTVASKGIGADAQLFHSVLTPPTTPTTLIILEEHTPLAGQVIHPAEALTIQRFTKFLAACKASHTPLIGIIRVHVDDKFIANWTVAEMVGYNFAIFKNANGLFISRPHSLEMWVVAVPDTLPKPNLGEIPWCTSESFGAAMTKVSAQITYSSIHANRARNIQAAWGIPAHAYSTPNQPVIPCVPVAPTGTVSAVGGFMDFALDDDLFKPLEGEGDLNVTPIEEDTTATTMAPPIATPQSPVAVPPQSPSTATREVTMSDRSQDKKRKVTEVTGGTNNNNNASSSSSSGT